jgi:hypothetical protein
MISANTNTQPALDAVIIRQGHSVRVWGHFGVRLKVIYLAFSDWAALAATLATF